MSGVIVTGAASGIGRSCAETLVAQGRSVALWDVDAGVADVASGLGMPHEVIDVCDTDAVDRAVQRTVATLDGVDGLVHAAGRVIPEPVGAYTEQSWDAVLDVNLRAHALLVQLLLPHLRQAAAAGIGPAVVGIASIEGLAASPYIPAYCASKAGLLGLTRSMAAQLGAEGIRVNAVCPGFIRTPMLQIAVDIDEVREGFERAAPLGRLGTPEEVAARGGVPVVSPGVVHHRYLAGRRRRRDQPSSLSGVPGVGDLRLCHSLASSETVERATLIEDGDQHERG